MYAIINPENGEFVYKYIRNAFRQKPRTWVRQRQAERYRDRMGPDMQHLKVVEVELKVVE